MASLHTQNFHVPRKVRLGPMGSRTRLPRPGPATHALPELPGQYAQPVLPFTLALPFLKTSLPHFFHTLIPSLIRASAKMPLPQEGFSRHPI